MSVVGRHSESVPPVERQHSVDELVAIRREALLLARACPFGSERNQYRQIALSLRALLRNGKWLMPTRRAMQVMLDEALTPHCPRCRVEMTKAELGRNTFVCGTCREIIQFLNVSAPGLGLPWSERQASARYEPAASVSATADDVSQDMMRCPPFPSARRKESAVPRG